MTAGSAPGLEEAARAKQAVRERVWALLERERAARFPGATGRIPNVAGASAAAARLAALPAWRAARVVKANPDAPQPPVRARALADRKLLYMVVPAWPTSGPSSSSTRHGWRSQPAGPPPSPARPGLGGESAWPRCDPWTWWCVAAWPSTASAPGVGKGGGFSDLEFALLVEAGLIGPDTVVATTVHPLQVLEGRCPRPTTTSAWI